MEGRLLFLNRSAAENLISKLTFVHRFERRVSPEDIQERDFLVEKISKG